MDINTIAPRKSALEVNKQVLDLQKDNQENLQNSKVIDNNVDKQKTKKVLLPKKKQKSKKITFTITEIRLQKLEKMVGKYESTKQSVFNTMIDNMM
jgi:hypothetical protein